MKTVLDDLEKGTYQRTPVEGALERYDFKKRGEIVRESKDIIFENVPILSPNLDTLVHSMNLKISKGQNLLILGPNGCGKSSLFRILGELWPIFDGKIHKPPINQLFYIPQRPYLPKGTLRDQIIYPHNTAKMYQRTFNDAKLLQLLKILGLEYIVEREGGWNTIKDWNSQLAGGEK
jgi:ATP-binding cassette, subfamily D (ALD), peroxisomal long-chain fatty acid import protein